MDVPGAGRHKKNAKFSLTLCAYAQIPAAIVGIITCSAWLLMYWDGCRLAISEPIEVWKYKPSLGPNYRVVEFPEYFEADFCTTFRNMFQQSDKTNNQPNLSPNRKQNKLSSVSILVLTCECFVVGGAGGDL